MEDNQQPQPNLGSEQAGSSPPENPKVDNSAEQPGQSQFTQSEAQVISPNQPSLSGSVATNENANVSNTAPQQPIAVNPPQEVLGSQPQNPVTSTPPQPPLNSESPTVSNSPMPSAPPELPKPEKTRGKMSKLLIPLVVIGILLLGGAAAAYNALILNSPEGIWKKAMSNTSKGFDELVNLASEEPAKGGTVEGSFKLSSPTVVDANFSGKWYDTKSQYNLDVGFAGVRPKVEIRTIPASEGASPDVYIKAEELEGLQGILGLYDPSIGTLLSEVNGTWYTIDHTLYEQALLSGDSESDIELKPEEIQEIGDKISAVLNERLFTADEEKAVVIVDEPIGKEEFKGSNTYKYNVRAQKEQTKQFVSALVESLKGTKIEELATEDTDKSFEEVVGLEDILENIEETDFTIATAEAWVDLDTKLLRNVRITPESDDESSGSGYIDIGIPYDGGDEIPFEFSLHFEESDSEEKVDATVGFSYNKESGAVKATLNVDGNFDNETIKAEGSLTATPSNEDIEVEVPAGAKNIYELLGFIYGGYPTGGQLPIGTLGATDNNEETPSLEQLFPSFDAFQL